MRAKRDAASFKRKFLYRVIKKKFRKLFGRFSSTDKRLIQGILDRKCGSYEIKNDFKSEVCLQKKVILCELDSKLKGSLDENSSYKIKQTGYETDHSEEIEKETTISQVIDNTDIDNSDKSEQYRVKLKLFDDNKIEEAKELFESRSPRNLEKEIVKEYNSLLNNPKINYKIVIENEHNTNPCIKLIDESNIQPDDTENRTSNHSNKLINEDIKIKHIYDSQKYVEQIKSCKCQTTPLEVDPNKSVEKVQTECVDYSPQKLAPQKEIVHSNDVERLRGKTETEQVKANKRKLFEENGHSNDGVFKTNNLQHDKDCSYLQILNIQSIVLEVENVLFKTVVTLQNTNTSDNLDFESKMKTRFDNANIIQTTHIFGNNELSNMLLQNVTLIYNYIRQYFHNVNVIEREGLDNFLKTKAREYIIERYCSLFYTCCQKIPNHTLLPNLHTDIQYASHLINTAKKLSNDENFNEILFLEIFNSFINFLIKFQKQIKNRRVDPDPERTKGNQYQYITLNENNRHISAEKTVEGNNKKAISTEDTSENYKNILPKKRGRKPRKATDSTASSNNVEQFEVAPPRQHSMDYEHYIKRKPNPLQPQLLVGGVFSQRPSTNGLQHAGTCNTHSRLNSCHNNQSVNTNYLFSRLNSMPTQGKDVHVPLNHTVPHTVVPSVPSNLQGNFGTFDQRPPPSSYARAQQTNSFNASHLMALQNRHPKPSETMGQNLPNIGQYKPPKEIYISNIERSQPFVSRDRGFVNAIDLRYHEQMMANNAPINFAKNAAAACFVCKKNTTRRCENCFSVFICSKVCELAVLDTHKYFCKGPPM